MGSTMRRIVAGLTALALCGGSTVQAGPIGPRLEFTITADAQGDSAVIFYLGPDEDNNSTALFGSNIAVSTVAGIDTALNDREVLQLFSGAGDDMVEAAVLNFQTGPFKSFAYDPYVTDDDGNIVSGTGVGRWNFSDGGSITIVGRTDPDDPDGDKTLLDGHFVGTPFVTHTDDDTSFKVLVGVFTDDVDPELAAFFGMSELDHRGDISLSFYPTLPDDGTFGDDGPPDAFPGDPFVSSSIGSGDVLSVAPVPEPGTATLATIGFLGLLSYGWRLRRLAAA